MPKADIKHVKELTLDRKNYRTLPQPSESAALKAMLAVNSTKFWALMESLLDDGYHLTENILVLKSGATGSELLVKEGNQRVAAIKLALGLINANGVEIPDYIQRKIDALTTQSKAAIERVPCAVYAASESETVDKIVALTHGKGEKASRTPWNAVAAARHSRDRSGTTESGLDLLERYLKNGSNLSDDQTALWAGDYNLTVLDEALRKIAPRLGFANAPELVAAYPSTLAKPSHRTGLETMLYDIGAETLGFPQIRDDQSDFAFDRYGFPPPSATKPGSNSSKGKSGATKTKQKKKSSSKPKAVSVRDPRSVVKRLGTMPIRGSNRDKVEALRQEAALLEIDDTPLAFCFVLRSMFELSAKAYCKDHKTAGLSTVKADGSEKKLATVLQEISKHLTNNNKDTEVVRRLHGAATELARPTSLFSVTSLNQLVHNPDFSVRGSDVSTMFNNVASLLEAMNE